jgi:hypothetical protein
MLKGGPEKYRAVFFISDSGMPDAPRYFVSIYVKKYHSISTFHDRHAGETGRRLEASLE